MQARGLNCKFKKLMQRITGKDVENFIWLSKTQFCDRLSVCFYSTIQALTIQRIFLELAIITFPFFHLGYVHLLIQSLLTPAPKTDQKAAKCLSVIMVCGCETVTSTNASF